MVTRSRQRWARRGQLESTPHDGLGGVREADGRRSGWDRRFRDVSTRSGGARRLVVHPAPLKTTPTGSLDDVGPCPVAPFINLHPWARHKSRVPTLRHVRSQVNSPAKLKERFSIFFELFDGVTEGCVLVGRAQRLVECPQRTLSDRSSARLRPSRGFSPGQDPRKTGLAGSRGGRGGPP